jgi:hypothetical protein
MEPVPGNKLPGYDHSVPPGQRPPAPIRPIAVSPIRRFALYGTVPLFAPIPGNKLPGYHHSVPPGRAQDQALRLVSDRPLSMMQPQKKICVICEICGSFRLICVRAYLPIGGRPYSLTLLSRNALATTDTELNDIAAPAMIGLRSSPKNG